MKAIIVANGRFAPTPDIRRELSTADMIIAADGGAIHLRKVSVNPDLIIGDLDSIDEASKDFFAARDIPVQTYPQKKDMTDTELCLEYAVSQGADEVVLMGVTGRRLDHTVANVLMLRRLLGLGVKGKILDTNNEIFLVDSNTTVKGSPGELLSVIPVTDRVTGLTLEGLAYPLTEKTLDMGTALGVSNVFTGDTATIKLRSGMVLVTKSRD
ncbi:MAG: thiamine diphosphokinase [Desulfobacterales bacterium]|nr:thiamine diphosphokinase [Desulfobacterales bacterium]